MSDPANQTKVRQNLKDEQNWKVVTNKGDYQFLDSFNEPTEQYLYYISEGSVSHINSVWLDFLLKNS